MSSCAVGTLVRYEIQFITLHYLNVLVNIYKLLNLCFAIKTISSHAFLIKIAKVIFLPVNYFHTYNKTTVLLLQNKET